MIPEEMPLAGYLLARALDGRKVEGEDFERLRAANDSVREVRALLPFGRGNAREDIIASRGASTTRTEGGRNLKKPFVAGRTAASIWAGAGNCAEHAQLSALAHAARLNSQSDGMTVYYTNDRVDHSWAEALVRNPSRIFDLCTEPPEPDDRDIVMDAWKDGPAVFSPDSATSRSDWNGARIKKRWKYLPEGLPNAKQQAQDAAGSHDPRNLPPRKYRNVCVWKAQPVVDEAFLKRVLPEAFSVKCAMPQIIGEVKRVMLNGMRRLQAKPKKQPPAMLAEFRREIMAVGIARELMAPPARLETTKNDEGRVRTAVNQAQDIVDAMKSLRRITPRGGSRTY
ncbi:MAG TPA: hypothetical protein VFP68_21825 [Burkholderiaceae bacterium]|nr:hypothetical protein [Burkholderiaceae bacterium]